MPNSFNPADGYFTQAEIILERPECAALIGAIAVEWGRIEGQLAWYFSAILLGIRDIQHGEDFVAMDVIEKTTSFQAKKLHVIRAAKRIFGNTDPDTEQFRKFLDALDSLAFDRNNILHGRWGLSPSHPTALIWRGKISDVHDGLVYEVDDFRKILSKMLSADRILYDFFTAKLKPRLKRIAESRIKATVAFAKIMENPTFKKLNDGT